MATSPFAGAGLSQFGQEMSGPGFFDEQKAKLKKVAAIALLNGTGATGFLDDLMPGFQDEIGGRPPPPTITPIKQQPIVPNNYVDNSGQIVSFNPYTSAKQFNNLDALSDHDIGNPYLEKYKE
jgi:hypothetical protein